MNENQLNLVRTSLSLGGAIRSTANLDDFARFSSCPSDNQAGNIYIEARTEAKLLVLNTDKSCNIVLGNGKAVQNLKIDSRKPT
jgi:hypothetical protein